MAFSLFKRIFCKHNDIKKDVNDLQDIQYSSESNILRIYIFRSDGFLQIFKYSVIQIKEKDNQLMAIAKLISPSDNQQYEFLKKIIIFNLKDLNKINFMIIRKDKKCKNQINDLFLVMTMTLNQILNYRKIQKMFRILNHKVKSVFVHSYEQIEYKINKSIEIFDLII